MSASFELRRATPDDADAIRSLTRAAYAKWVALSGREPQPMTADYEAAVRAHRFDLLYMDGALAALIETVDEGDVLLVENVAVAPRHQGRGLGTRLMALADEIARSEGKRRVRLYTNKLWAENIALYQRLGYGIDREEPRAPGLVRVYMSKAPG
ncbi:MAG TPA: GNAT family N-acetyltransferase [Caulobacteraceae bacterium]|nr:GNAT family N-acetyltransferase [Caulobacteraceae bacterium]